MEKQMIATPTWFITGASSGFGLAFARYALDQGYNVVATARSLSKLETLIEKNSDRLLLHKLDVTVPAEVSDSVEAAIHRFGRIDVLINNAGYGAIGAVEETPDEVFRSRMETNFFGALSTIKAVLPHMRQQKAGAIVNFSSLGGKLSFPGIGAVSASKFALEGMSEALAQEVAPLNIKVMILEPGAFRTNFNDLEILPEMDDYKDVMSGIRTAVGQYHGRQPGDPYKAARAVDTALASDKTPLRLQVGADAVEGLRAHGEKFLADLSAWESVAIDTQIDEMLPSDR
jgi:NAD(P)-dependent dehydrogenase (short-subunit alcohol dehydrogenase family)